MLVALSRLIPLRLCPAAEYLFLFCGFAAGLFSGFGMVLDALGYFAHKFLDFLFIGYPFFF